MDDRWKTRGWINPKIEDGKLSKWNWLVQKSDGLKLGKLTDIGAFTLINAANGVIIEDEVQIGPHCSILSASTIDHKYGPVVLKKKCCVGAGSVVMPNTTIGENSIVGALSFVNRNIPDNEVWGGVPAKKIK